MTEPVYLIAQIDVKDFDAYLDRYGMPVFGLFQAAGAEVLVATRDTEVLEGEWFGNWTVIARFPDRDAAAAFINSAEYAPLRKLRVEELSSGGNVAMAPGFGVGTA